MLRRESESWFNVLYAPKQIKGGIKRVKQHLTGGYGDIVKCPNTTREIAKEMNEVLNNGKRARPLYLDDDVMEDEAGQDDDVQVMGSRSMSVSSKASSCTVPSTRTAAKRNKAIFQLKPHPIAAPKKSIASMIRWTPQEVVAEKHAKGPAQTTISATLKPKEGRNYVCLEIAKFFYDCGIPFNAAYSRQFEVAVEAIAQYGYGFKPPTFHELREPLLSRVVKDIDDERKKHKEAWIQYGCTLMSDGWTDKRGCHLINFLVNWPQGTFFLESVDASNESHSAVMLADLLEKIIEGIGKENVTQIATNNGANYKATGKILMERIPTLFWTPCAAHCLDLMLEDIGKLKDFKKPIARARHVTTFIYRHGRILSEMRVHTNGMDIVRPAATRFATAFLTMKSLHKHKNSLKGLFSSDVFHSIQGIQNRGR
jgi:hypothetical protein